MVNVQSITKKYNGKLVVGELSFSIQAGESLVFLGTSGSGKTTTLKMINKLVIPDSGQITINGEDINNQPAEHIRRQIGYVIQHTGLFPHYTVAQNIGVVPGLLGWDKPRTMARTTELLEMVGLAPGSFLHRMPHQLSGGQKQRVGIARALAADPPLILLDEPFGALDPITRAQLQAEFKRLGSLLNKTMALVTHDVAEAIYLGDRICLMDKGTIQQIGSPKSLVFKPQNQFVKDFFGSNLLQSQMLAVQMAELAPYLTQTIRENIAQESVYHLLQNAKMMEDTGLAEKEVIDAFYKAKQSLLL